jgi:hypothetical protein
MRSRGIARVIALSEKIDEVIELAKLDLGRKLGDMGCCSPSSAGNTKYYPSIWIDDRDEPVDLPLRGKATVDYVVVSRTARERDGKTKYDASIEIRSIDPQTEKEQKLPGSAKAVKLGALVPGMISFDRVRNQDGEFAPETSGGGVDPNTMAAAYGPGAIATNAAAMGAGTMVGTAGGVLAAKLLRNKLKLLK